MPTASTAAPRTGARTRTGRTRTPLSGAGTHRPEIEGLRAVAVLLVAVHHIWSGRVSGGVDVFLLLTGFLITGSLVRALEREGRIRLLAFWSRLAKRLLPASALVLGGVLCASPLWLPASRWQDVIAHTRASALYYENWLLAHEAVDYLARDGALSPLQHFWSLSVQGQFYLLWPLLLTAAAVLAARMGWRVRHAVLAAAAAVFGCSLAYSVAVTGTDPAWAYFDTGARLWELALGGLLALTLPLVRLPGRVRLVLGWAGLAALAACGVLLPASVPFPGYAALWPTGAAVLVVLAGTTGSRWGADRLLTWRPLAAVGGMAYALYLWHWPVLVFYLEATGRTTASPTGGALVLGLSFLLAAATTRIVQDGVTRLTRPAPRATARWSLGVAAAALAPVLAATALWTAHLDQQQRLRAELAADPRAYAGAGALTDPAAARAPRLPVLPDPADAREDLSRHHRDGCHVNLAADRVAVCEYGPAGAEHTIALVGASRTAHWFPALEAAARANGWRILSFTKSGCQFSTETPHREGAVFTECQEWDAQAMEVLAELRPDAVLTSSTRATPAGETVHAGFVERWRELDRLGIDVIGIRDVPRVDYSGAECVERHGAEACVCPASYSQAGTDPTAELADPPGNVSFIDLTPYVCPEGRCPAVIGNVMVFWDHSHMTATFAHTLAPMMEQALREATGW